MTHKSYVEKIQKIIPKNEKTIGTFFAQHWPFGWIVLLGPIGMFLIKQYYVTVTKQKIYFHTN